MKDLKRENWYHRDFVLFINSSIFTHASYNWFFTAEATCIYEYWVVIGWGAWRGNFNQVGYTFLPEWYIWLALLPLYFNAKTKSSCFSSSFFFPFSKTHTHSTPFFSFLCYWLTWKRNKYIFPTFFFFYI